MFTKLREPFGKAGLVVAIVALIAALGGGAYAASGGLSGKQKKEVTKIAQTEAKKFAGKTGATGATGPAGAAGAAGAKGDKGDPGTAGGPGANGKSVVSNPIAPGEPTRCSGVGGAELEVEGSGAPAEICNGQPWTPSGLPQGATETGAWSFNASLASANGAGRIFVPLSLSVPLSAAIEGEANIHYVEPGGPAGPCTGTVHKPTAPAGMLCIYANEPTNATFGGERELANEEPNIVDLAGGLLTFTLSGDHAIGNGSFAVTGG